MKSHFEYAYLRDLWEASRAGNETKRALITNLIDTEDARQLSAVSVSEWNRHFGVGTPVASGAIIQSPSAWSLRKFHESIPSNEEFLATCKFKWSFNIKPDLVVHTTNRYAVVIEAKYSSREGFYPSTAPERAIFMERGLARVGQTALQKYMFKDLLGVEAIYLFVVNDWKAKSETHRTLLWSEVLSALDTSRVPSFVTNWMRLLAVGPRVVR